MSVFANAKVLLLIIGVALLLGIIAGLYPSLYLSSFKPASILKGGEIKNKKSMFKSLLVITQFSLAIAMIVATLVVLQQLSLLPP